MAVDTLTGGAAVHSVAMAVAAVQSAMSAAQREETQRVLKICLLPKLLQMAGPALGQGAAMDVVFLMAYDTLLAQAAQSAILFMALGARQGIMHAVQCEVAMEVLGVAPAALVMAFLATGAEIA